jgi:hypothetical protein
VDADGAEVLARLNLPFGSPEWGSVDTKSWAAIHSSPPWDTTEHAALTRHDFGDGQAVFSPVVLERAEPDASRALFVHLVRRLLGSRQTLSADARSGVWLSAYDQQDSSRMLVALHAYGAEEPRPREAVSFRVAAPEGRRLRAASAGPGLEIVSAEVGGDSAAVSVELVGELGFAFVEYE